MQLLAKWQRRLSVEPENDDTSTSTHKHSSARQDSLIEVLHGLLVLIADEFDQVGVEHHLMIHPNGERLRVGFGIVDRDVDLQVAIIWAAKPFR
ncbi:MAG TPA: hypothetical protein VJA26_03385 [Gammaproteobacteria bacterium]|nr:hypothetical protein [Gammaproteobacteria bacterium]